MNIENEIFKRTHVNFEKLEDYGFKKNDDKYIYSKEFLENFKAEISIDKNGGVSAKVIDLEFGDEYTNIRVENTKGEFVNRVKDEYKKILKDIRDKCFEKELFITPQANRIAKYIMEKYNDEPEFLWEKYTGSAIFRNKNNEKWYSLIMNIDKSKIDEDSGEVEIIDLKAEESMIKNLIKEKGFYEGYHMNKKSWLTIILDDTISDEVIFSLIDNSYNLVSTPTQWIIPANPSYYDVINCFNDTDIVTWKQSSKVHIGDTVYMYVAAPYSSIMYKCRAVEVDIPYGYKDKNLTINCVMKLKLLKRYEKDEISFSMLNSLGIKSIRGPRKVSKEVTNMFD